MKSKQLFPLLLILAAVITGCSSVPQNTSLEEAHSIYDSARNDPQVTSLAAVELKQAGDTLSKADTALHEKENSEKVDNLAYIAKQQVAIAVQTAKRKTAEQAVEQSTAERDKMRLDIRTGQLQEASEQIARQKQELAELNAKESERGLVITLGDVLFRTNMATLEPGGRRNVQKLADFLGQYPQYKALIEGHTDSMGGEALNQALSERRANSVKSALADMGVSQNRITTRGYGEAYPVASNNTAAGRQQNRRVEIILSDKEGEITPRW
jgi:outer membrane protein OmpA-like peptidoglycan-associated protein